jgi:hypothetical protein
MFDLFLVRLQMWILRSDLLQQASPWTHRENPDMAGIWAPNFAQRDNNDKSDKKVTKTAQSIFCIT